MQASYFYLYKVVVNAGDHEPLLEWDPDHTGFLTLVFGVVPSGEGLLQVTQLKVLVSRQLSVYVCVWVGECVCVCECVSEWVCDWVSEWVCVCVCATEYNTH